MFAFPCQVPVGGVSRLTSCHAASQAGIDVALLAACRHTCGFCDYSVPADKLLRSHELLHQQPNRNLLATQSIMNLTKLKPIAADTQLAQSAELADGSVTDVHDHLALYENVDSATETENHSG